MEFWRDWRGERSERDDELAEIDVGGGGHIIVEHFGSALERRAQRQPHTFSVPRVEARASNHAWTWDITKLAGANKGEFYFLYSVIDLFNRYVVGWMVAERESAELAEQLLSDAYDRHNT